MFRYGFKLTEIALFCFILCSCSKPVKQTEANQKQLDSAKVERIDTLACWKSAFCIGQDTTGRPSHGASGIAFLRGGEVWFFDFISKRADQITKTGGKVGGFSFSLGFRYLAIQKAIGSHKEAGEWEDTTNIPERADLQINVIDLTCDSVVWSSPSNGESAYIQCWCQNDVLTFNTADDFAVEGYYEYFVHRDTLITRRYNREARKCPEESGQNDTLIAHGIHLWRLPEYLVRMNATGGSNQILGGPMLSPDSLMVALFSVRDVKNHTSYLDEIWLHNLGNNTFGSIYQQPARSEHKFIMWSPSGRRLGMFFTSSAIIFDTGGKEKNSSVLGGSFTWAPGDWVLYDYYSKVYLFDPATGASIQILADADMPSVAVWRQSKMDSLGIH